MKDVPRFIQVRQIGHFYKVNSNYGRRVAEDLGIPASGAA
jgi:catalase